MPTFNDTINIFRKLISLTKDDFLGYYGESDTRLKVHRIVQAAMSDTDAVSGYKNELDRIIPDTDDDGSWECSYALNAGCILMNLIDFIQKGDETLLEEAITLYTDTLDFKVQQSMERNGFQKSSESEITNHPIYVNGLALLKSASQLPT